MTVAFYVHTSIAVYADKYAVYPISLAYDNKLLLYYSCRHI